MSTLSHTLKLGGFANCLLICVGGGGVRGRPAAQRRCLFLLSCKVRGWVGAGRLPGAKPRFGGWGKLKQVPPPHGDSTGISGRGGGLLQEMRHRQTKAGERLDGSLAFPRLVPIKGRSARPHFLWIQ